MSQTVRTTESSDGGSAPLTVAAVAGELGVAAATLRTWDRRYGLGPSDHEAGSHRRYTPSDVARLQLMRRLTLRGVAPGDAARIATSGTEGEHGGLPTPEPPSEEIAEPPLLIDPLSLAAAAVEADIDRLARIMRKAVRTHGLIGAWHQVAAPARELLVSEHHRHLQRPGVDPLAVLDVAVLLAARTAAGEHEASAHAPVLLQAEPDAQLEAHVLAGALGEREVPVLVLAPDAPDGLDPLDPLDGERGAHLRVLVVLGAPCGVEDLVTRASRRGDIEVYLVGPRCPQLWLPHVHRVRTLEAAVAEITVSAGGATAGSAAEIRDEVT